MDKETYSKYLSDPRWREKRQEVLKEHHDKCDMCGSSDSLQVHHKSYLWNLMPWEYPANYYQVLCKMCHSSEHGRRYMDKKCKQCKTSIADAFEYCFSCFSNLQQNIERDRLKIENQKSNLFEQEASLYEEKIEQLELENIELRSQLLSQHKENVIIKKLEIENRELKREIESQEPFIIERVVVENTPDIDMQWLENENRKLKKQIELMKPISKGLINKGNKFPLLFISIIIFFLGVVTGLLF
ncbi:MAG: hypothetical protein HQK63_15430 [Desulfamplus sp.]|nr:hypothetical protein [Desulfamplus sp.]